MSAEEWERIKSVFDSALSLPSEERPAYLDAACVGRSDLRSVVDHLLKNLEDAGGFLEDPSSSGFGIPVFRANQIVAERFRIVRLIASGGMGEVYEVFDERLNLRVALKTIRTELIANRQTYERFKREVWVTREVAHEGICRIFELIEHHDGESVIPCITMKLLEGQNLQSALRTRRPLPLAESMTMIRQICSALQILHEHGIVHGDLKPSNIMLVPTQGDGVRVVLTDFGLARRLDHSRSIPTVPDQQPGAPYFQSPELLRGGKENVASDIYSLGLVIDEMATDSRAFTAESIHTLYWQKLWEKPIPPARRAANLPPAWSRVILRCLAPNPAQRYAKATDIVADLESTEQVEEAPVEEPVHQPAGKPVVKSRMRRLLLAFLLAFLAVPVFGIALIPALPGRVWPHPMASMLVTPVSNDTGNADYEYLARGTTTELLRRLEQIENLQVFSLRESDPRVAEVEKIVQFRLQSQLRQSAGGHRLTVRLSDTRNGQLLWSEQSETTLTDPVALQYEIATGAIQSLKEHIRLESPVLGDRFSRMLDPLWRLIAGAKLTLPRPATTNPAAFQNFLRGQLLFEERTPKAANEAMTYYQRAVKEDPNFALAWAAMADVERLLMEHSSNQADLLTRAREYAEKAVQIDPMLPEAHSTLGAVLQVDWQWDRADQSYRRAIELFPRFARAQRQYGGMLLELGQMERGLEMMKQSIEIDPFDYPSQAVYGFGLLFAGRPAEARDHLKSLLAHKDLHLAHIILGQVYATLAANETGEAAASDASKALAEAEIVMKREQQEQESSGDDFLKWSTLIYAVTYAYQGQPGLAQPYLERLESGRRMGRISSASVAYVYAALKDYERAMDLLEMSAAYHEKELTLIDIVPYFRPMHEYPRFRRLLTTMGLTSRQPESE